MSDYVYTFWPCVHCPRQHWTCLTMCTHSGHVFIVHDNTGHVWLCVHILAMCSLSTTTLDMSDYVYTFWPCVHCPRQHWTCLTLCTHSGHVFIVHDNTGHVWLCVHILAMCSHIFLRKLNTWILRTITLDFSLQFAVHIQPLSEEMVVSDGSWQYF